MQLIHVLSLALVILQTPSVSAQSIGKSNLRTTEQQRHGNSLLFKRATEQYLAKRNSSYSDRDNFSQRLSDGQKSHGEFDQQWDISAELPHLRMDLRITSVELNGPLNVPVGDFVVKTYLISDAHVENSWSSENVPTIQIPDDDFGTVTLNKIILSALMYDGCKESSVINVSSNGSAGPTYLMDEEAGAELFSTVTGERVESLALEGSVQGPGFYVFSFTMDSVGAELIVSGDAPVYCTAATQPLSLN